MYKKHIIILFTILFNYIPEVKDTYIITVTQDLLTDNGNLLLFQCFDADGLDSVFPTPAKKYTIVSSGTHTARRKHGGQLPLKLPSCPQTNLSDIFLISFLTNVPPECHKYRGTNQKNLLLAPLAALFCTPILKMVAPPIIAMVS